MASVHLFRTLNVLEDLLLYNKNMKLTFSKKNLSFYIISVLILVVFIISLFFYIKGYKKRYVFIFPAVDEGQYVLENRYFQKYNKEITDLSANEYYLNRYVDDLLLGSTLERTKLLFKLGTKAEECYLRGDILYLNLSKDLISVGNETVDIKTGVELLEQNIKKNFSKVKKIELFVDGKYAFENEKIEITD